LARNFPRLWRDSHIAAQTADGSLQGVNRPGGIAYVRAAETSGVQPNPDQRRRRPLQAWTCGGERATKTDRAVLGMGAMTAAGVVWARNHVRAIALALAVAVAAPAFAAESPPNPDTPPVAVAARIEQSDGAARLTFDLSRFVEAHAFQLADPDRIIIDVPEVNFQIDPAVGRAAADTRAGSLIKSFRFGLLAPGKSR
jgi:hypothetical protein